MPSSPRYPRLQEVSQCPGLPHLGLYEPPLNRTKTPFKQTRCPSFPSAALHSTSPTLTYGVQTSVLMAPVSLLPEEVTVTFPFEHPQRSLGGLARAYVMYTAGAQYIEAVIKAVFWGAECHLFPSGSRGAQGPERA